MAPISHHIVHTTSAEMVSNIDPFKSMFTSLAIIRKYNKSIKANMPNKTRARWTKRDDDIIKICVSENPDICEKNLRVMISLKFPTLSYNQCSNRLRYLRGKQFVPESHTLNIPGFTNCTTEIQSSSCSLKQTNWWNISKSKKSSIKYTSEPNWWISRQTYCRYNSPEWYSFYTINICCVQGCGTSEVTIREEFIFILLESLNYCFSFNLKRVGFITKWKLS